MTWNFFDLVRECGLRIIEISEAPEMVGYYMLFAELGEFIYVGKADDLRQRLSDHFGPNEMNERIKGIAKYAIWEQTKNMTEAEQAEGDLYDTWVTSTGLSPFANKNKPSRSKLSDSEILVAKLRHLLKKVRTLAKTPR